jgi:hypothetical protein
VRVCILGNSHTASLRQGWDDIQRQWPGVEITFFASRAHGLAGLDLRDGRLLPSNAELARDLAYTSGGRDSVDLDCYDVFLVYGSWLVLPPLDPRLSSAVRKAAIRDLMHGSLNFSICSMLLGKPAAVVFSGHDPQPAGDPEGACVCSYDQIFASAAGFARECGIRLVKQPLATFGNSWNTAPALSKGSTRLDLGDSMSNELHVEWDVIHMNREFGRIYMQQFLNDLHLTLQAGAANTLHV